VSLLPLIAFPFLWGNTCTAAELVGHIVDRDSDMPVNRALVAVGRADGALSDSAGTFRVAGLAAGEIDVRVTHVAYEPWTGSSRVPEDGEVRLEVRLVPLVRTTDVIEVKSRRLDRSVSASRHALTPRVIQESAGVVSTDVFRVVQAIPGVAPAGNDFSDRFVVRGGDPEENIVLLDGIQLFQPSHLDGLTPVVCDELIASAELYGGPLPIRYGDALSSVTTLELLRPERNGGFARYDLAAGAIGGFGSRPGSSVLGAVRTNLIDLSLGRPRGVTGRSFRDATSKAQFALGRNVVSVLLLGSHDREEGDFDRTTTQYLGGLKIVRREGRFFGTMGTSVTEADRRASSSNEPEIRADHLRLAMTGETGWIPSQTAQARSVFEIRRESLRDVSGRISEWGGNLALEGTFGPMDADRALRPHPAVIAIGGRLEKIPFTRGIWFGPYASAKLAGPAGTSVGAAWRIARQSPFTLDDDIEIGGAPVNGGELLREAKGRLKPVRASVLSGSLDAALGAGITASAEAYRKEYARLLAWPDSAGPTREFVTNGGHGLARGLEFALRREAAAGPTGFIAYSISRTRKREGTAVTTVPADYDRPRMLQLSISIPLDAGTCLALAARFATGRPISSLALGHLGSSRMRLGDGDRLPSYRRIDLKLSHRALWKDWDILAYMDVLNITVRENIDDVLVYEDANGQIHTVIKGGVPITPIGGVTVRF
jgi:hypothetical protein